MTTEVKKRIEDMNNGILPGGYKQTKLGVIPEQWKVCHFKELFSRLKRKNTENNTNVLTISAQYGLINQEEFFNKSVASEDKSNYYLLYKGDFAYNKSYSNGYPFGAIKSLEKYDKGVVSPLYICFSPTDKNKCPDFYLQYFEHGLMNREIQAIAQEGARNHGLLNIGIDDFFNSYLLFPTVEEQKKIASILSAQEKLISLQEQKVEALKKLKKGYLEKMFPKSGSKYPELRLKGFTDAWEQRKLGEVCQINGRIGFRGYTEKDIIPKEQGGVLAFTPTNIVNNQLALNVKNTYITRAKYDESPEIMVKNGNILFVKTGSTLGKSALVTGFNEDSTVNPQVVVIKTGVSNQKILSTILTTDKVQSQVASVKIGGAVPTMTETELKNIELSMPVNEDERIRIGTFFTELDTLITLHQRKLETEKKKKKAIMQLLLTGKVRV